MEAAMSQFKAIAVYGWMRWIKSLKLQARWSVYMRRFGPGTSGTSQRIIARPTFGSTDHV